MSIENIHLSIVTRLEFAPEFAESLDMTHAWFIYSNSVVSGPFSTEAVHEKISLGHVDHSCHIWWKGQREWIPISTWAGQVERIVQNANDRSQKPVWYVDSGKSPTGPLTEKELIDHLKTCGSLARVRLWAVGMEKWTSLFELSEVMELLGLSRRENGRAPLMGTVTLSRSNDDPQGFVLRAASISVSGMGVQGRHDLRAGDTISVVVKSGEIAEQLQLRGEIAYVTSNGYAGIRFEKVLPDTHSIILEYVERFNSDDKIVDQAA
jgi:hypothetical protein